MEYEVMNNFDIGNQDAEELINTWNTRTSKEKGGGRNERGVISSLQTLRRNNGRLDTLSVNNIVQGL